MAWQRLGRVFCCNGRNGWMHSHAYVPTAFLLPDRVRIYVAFRDDSGIGRVGYVDLDDKDPMRVIGVSERPVLDIGPAGAFDESGVTPLSIVENRGEIWMYYAGWQLSSTVRYFLFTGLAISRDGGDRFERHSNVPVMDRTNEAWQVRSGAFVIRTSSIWKCWHAMGASSANINSKKIPIYDWAFMESEDGIHWPDNSVVTLAANSDSILGFGRSHVRWKRGYWEALIPVRGSTGKYDGIAHTVSRDGIHWGPLDYDLGLRPSGRGFDSSEVSFPSVFKTGGRDYMAYNGNDFGLTGFGLAVWQD